MWIKFYQMMKNLLVPEQTSWWTFFVQKVLSNSTTSIKSVRTITLWVDQQKWLFSKNQSFFVPWLKLELLYWIAFQTWDPCLRQLELLKALIVYACYRKYLTACYFLLVILENCWFFGLLFWQITSKQCTIFQNNKL